MIARLNLRSRRDPYGPRINRDHSPTLAYTIPWATILLGSILPIFPVIGAVPLMPPLGFLLLVSWRLMRPGLLPAWAGFPLGAFDDLFSGQPFGSAIMLWSFAMLALEAVEARFPWRGFVQDWLAASGLIAIYLVAATLFSGAAHDMHILVAIAPQLLLSVLAFPIIARMVAILDRLRLLRVRVVE